MAGFGNINASNQYIQDAKDNKVSIPISNIPANETVMEALARKVGKMFYGVEAPEMSLGIPHRGDQMGVSGPVIDRTAMAGGIPPAPGQTSPNQMASAELMRMLKQYTG
jgi:hypothetical protein